MTIAGAEGAQAAATTSVPLDEVERMLI